jgi:hypothetical protein
MKHLGPSIDIRDELSKCGVFRKDNKNIGIDLREMIENGIEVGQTVLHPRLA